MPRGVEPADDGDAVVKGRGVDENDVGIGIANRKRDRNGVGERRRPHPIEDDLHVALWQRLVQALEVGDAGAGIVADQRRGLNRTSDFLRLVLEQLDCAANLGVGAAKVAEDIFVAAGHQFIAEAESEHGHLLALADLAGGERKRAEEAAHKGRDMLLAQEALRGVGRRLHTRTGVRYHEV